MSSFRSAFVIRRKEPGNYVDGKWQEGQQLAFIINASIQPLKGKEMEMLPEGRRHTQSIRIYTNTKLNTVNDANPDIIEAFGDSFEIFSVEPWQSNVINHYKCIGIKVGEAVISEELVRITTNGYFRATVDNEIRIYN